MERKDGSQGRTVVANIDKGNLPRYFTAGELSGYEVCVKEEGLYPNGDPLPDNIAQVVITRPTGQKDHQLFWNCYDNLLTEN